jgi:hypothetical protein
MNIVLDYRGWHLGRRIGRAIGLVSGTVLLLLGLVASTVAVPTSLVVIGLVLGRISNESADWLPPEMPAAQVVLAWVVACPTAIVGTTRGLRLVRGQRRLVIFLRRFGYDDATRAVTFAVRTIGASWRLVTLDDEEIAPLGVSLGARTIFGALRQLSTAALWAGKLPVRIFPFVTGAMWVVVAAQLLTASHWSEVARVDMEVVEDIFEWRLPFQRVAPTLPGAFAAFAIGAAIAFGGLMVTFVALLAALPLSALLIFFSSSLESVQEAERSKTLNVQTLADLESAATLTVERTRKVFGPRLVVLRVASSIWQAAVDRLARCLRANRESLMGTGDACAAFWGAMRHRRTLRPAVRVRRRVLQPPGGRPRTTPPRVAARAGRDRVHDRSAGHAPFRPCAARASLRT